jgi:ricin-type beta-trefoil lectin protein
VSKRLRTQVRIVVAAAVAALMTVGLIASPASASSWVSDDWIQAMGRSKDCLDTPTGTAGSNGGTVQVYGCKSFGASDELNQRWLLNYDSAKSAFEIRSAYSNICLDADTNTPGNGTRVQMWQCNGSDQQRWWLLASNLVPSRVSPVGPPGTNYPFYLANVYHSRIMNRYMTLQAPGTSGRLVRLWEADEEDKTELWDGFELQCAYAYRSHMNAVTHGCM